MAQTALIFGGSGKVSRLLTKLLSSQSPPWKVYSLIRSSAQSESLTALGATSIVQSIEDSSVSSLAETIKKCAPSVVIWSAGAGGGDPSRTDKVDREGAIKSMDACVEAGVKRYIIVSAIDVRDRDNKPVPDWYNEGDLKRSDGAWGAIGAYMRAKLAADTELRTGNGKRGLDYTIVRPGGLTENPGAGTVAAGKVHLTTTISREDVAGVIFACIQNEGTIGLAFDVVGGDTPIAEAVKKAVDNKEDTFDGLH
jgi:nucleoside-diphosphate-sugar epimerase